MSNWLSDSIMAKKGEANGKQNSSHSITEDSQGKYHYVLGAYAEPVLKVDPGALISVETHDAFEGKIEKVTHEEIQQAAKKAQPNLITLIKKIIN